MGLLKRKSKEEVQDKPSGAKSEAPKKDVSRKEESAKPMQNDDSYYVQPHPDGGWQVKKAGAQKALKKFKTKAEAEEYAKQVATNQGSSVVRVKKDGQIQDKKWMN